MSSIFKKCVHPAVELVWFTGILCFTIAVRHPLYSAVSLAAAVFFNLAVKNWSGIKSILWLVPAFIFLSCLNPLVSHWGNTTLFMIFGQPFTREAFCYGLNMGLTFVVMVEWFTCFSAVMTTDKFTYLLSPVFPSVSLMLVMILRMIPFARRRFGEIRQARLLGGVAGKGLKEWTEVSGAVLSSILEDGVLTAKTMEKRGYGKNVKRRTSFLDYPFRLSDAVRLFVCLVLAAFVIYGIVKKAAVINFYPEVSVSTVTGDRTEVICFTAYALFVFVPGIEKMIERLR